MVKATFWNLLNGALELEPDVFRQAEALPTGLRTALLVVLLAGVSTALGQSAVLFINRIKVGRFAASLIVAAVIFAFTYLFWTTSTLLIARYVFHSTAPWRGVAIAVGLGYAPRVFGLLVFMPFFGIPVFVLLSLWSLLAILTGVGGVLGLPAWQALLCSVLGWLVLQLLERTVGRPVVGVARWLRRRAAGAEVVTGWRGLEALMDSDPNLDSVDPESAAHTPAPQTSQQKPKEEREKGGRGAR